MNTWIVVAARDGAKLFQQKAVSGPWQMIAEYRNPEGKKQDKDLGSDKPGRSTEGGASARHSFSPHQPPREHLLETFLITLAETLNSDHEKKLFDSLVIVADSHILGLLKKHMAANVQARISRVVVKNLLHQSEADIQSHIQSEGL